MHRLILLLFVCVFGAASVAQSLEGVLVNARQNPFKGLKVWRKNTCESVLTDKLGNFGFSGLSATDTLVVFVSKKKEIVFPVKRLCRVKLKIEKDFYWLDDGEKLQKKEYRYVFRQERNTNVLTREQIQRLSAGSIYDLLRGSISGVTVSYSGSGQMVSVRGNNSLSLNTEPLFIIDGMTYENSSDVDAAVSIDNIERIEVLKDGAAYGVKGSNGAIIITTVN